MILHVWRIFWRFSRIFCIQNHKLQEVRTFEETQFLLNNLRIKHYTIKHYHLFLDIFKRRSRIVCWFIHILINLQSKLNIINFFNCTLTNDNFGGKNLSKLISKCYQQIIKGCVLFAINFHVSEFIKYK